MGELLEVHYIEEAQGRSRNKLRWFVPIERKQEKDWMKKIKTFKMEGKGYEVEPGRPLEVINNDLRSLHANGRRSEGLYEQDHSWRTGERLISTGHLHGLRY